MVNTALLAPMPSASEGEERDHGEERRAAQIAKRVTNIVVNIPEHPCSLRRMLTRTGGEAGVACGRYRMAV